MVTRLVAVCVLPDESGHIRYIAGPVTLHHKEAVQFLREALLSEQVNQTLHIVRHQECVLPGISFHIVGIIPFCAERIEWGAEFALEIAAAHEP